MLVLDCSTIANLLDAHKFLFSIQFVAKLEWKKVSFAYICKRHDTIEGWTEVVDVDIDTQHQQKVAGAIQLNTCRSEWWKRRWITIETKMNNNNIWMKSKKYAYETRTFNGNVRINVYWDIYGQ